MNLLRITSISLFSIFLFACSSKKKQFEPIAPSHSGINFNNEIIENDSINELDIENVYNGGGVGIGDFNRDGLQDIYLTGNLVSCKLYLNKGDFEFKDITDEANVSGNGEWCRGAAVVDINNDGWQDIYVCATLKSKPSDRKNLLYVNQGVDKSGVPHFKEMAAEYGLADSAHSTQAAFFDYDNDGDLDVYIVENEINKNVFPDNFHPVIRDGSNPSTGKLFQNNWSDSLKHPLFSDVSKAAGIQTEGYGHAVNITDINNDGWKDIYVTNDFISNDLLWINNHDGTFSEQLSTYFKHTSANAMGNDIVDINNDGWPDVVALDMNPEDNYRKKMMLLPNGYQKYQYSDLYGYNYQYVRNTLQLNQGPRVGQNDSLGVPVFSEIGFYSGIAETDWSWTPVVADLDNDGNRDIFITNGFPKDITDHDFTMYRQQAYQLASKSHLLSQIPEVKISNYAYKNNADLSFSDVTSAWGLDLRGFSNGAVSVDLDNDGDLDLVINKINDITSLYRNRDREADKDNSHYLQVKFVGDSLNREGLGAWITLHYDHGKIQIWENTPYRGYLSTIDQRAHFGLGKITTIDSIVVKWPNGKMQLLNQIEADQLLVLSITDAQSNYTFAGDPLARNTLFKEVTDAENVHYIHRQKDFIDFNIQKLLPHKFSEYGPGIAAGDLNGDGLDDMIVGGAVGNSSQLFFQQNSGGFVQRPLSTEDSAALTKKREDDTGLLLFDADGDGDLDLYIASGGFETASQSPAYQDKLYVNNGRGQFSRDTSALPTNLTSKFCVRAVDFDKDGDLDLFIAGRVDPWNYPRPVSSFIYRNDSKDGHIKFTDVTHELAPDLDKIGLVCDAVFSDFDNDGWPDLVLAGEWMPITFLKNTKGKFTNVSTASGISTESGWWNSIAPGDFDHDGDIDYIVGNLGLNSIYKGSAEFPVSIYAKDFDNNGSYDAFPTYYIATSQEDKTKREYPAQGRDDVVKQMIGMRSKFQNYKTFALATFDQLFTKEQLKDAIIRKATNFKSSYIRNDGNGKFTIIALPQQAQFSVLNGMVTDDFDNDGNLDVLINGNDYGTEVVVGRYDALNGLLLKGDGKGGFYRMTILQSGIFIPGNGKALVKLRSKDGRMLIAAGQNRGPLKIFQLKSDPHLIPANVHDAYAEIKYKNGTTARQEFYYGSSFLSASVRFLSVGGNVESITIYDDKGNPRKLPL